MITISWSALIAICAAVVTFSGAVSAIVKFVKWLKRPEEKQNANINKLNTKIDKLEERIEVVENKLSTDKSRLEDLETGLKLTLESLLALLSHALDGNDVEGLRKSTKDLNQYLLGKVEK